ncbi:MAG TPA: twin-arginine translocase TatA/TatE family subunit [Anaerolineae bacterium]
MGEIFGIGIEELIFIGILVALLFGPESLPHAARRVGLLLNRLFRSPLYKEGLKIRKQINDLPAALARLAELEEIQKNLNDEISDLKKVIDPAAKLAAESLHAAEAQMRQDADPGSAPDAGADRIVTPPAPADPAADSQPNDPTE